MSTSMSKTRSRHPGRITLCAVAARVSLCWAFCACSARFEPESCGLAPAPDGLDPETHLVYLQYADGQTEIPNGGTCNGEAIPPPFACGDGATVDCQLATHAILDAWFAEFDVAFTLQPPAAGPFQTVVVTDDGSWCGKPAGVAGSSRFDCTDQREGVAYALRCGGSALSCAKIIAHEYGHIVGLEHVMSAAGIMNPGLCGDACAGFEDQDHPLEGGNSLCGAATSQNSHQLLLERLGTWTQESAKPDPFDCNLEN
jgi:hypothetical protein